MKSFILKMFLIQISYCSLPTKEKGKHETIDALGNMVCNKAPGNDGLTIKFYLIR